MRTQGNRFIYPAGVHGFVNDNILCLATLSSLFVWLQPRLQHKLRRLAPHLSVGLTTIWIVCIELIPGFLPNTRDPWDIPAGLIGAALTYLLLVTNSRQASSSAQRPAVGNPFDDRVVSVEAEPADKRPSMP
jgi:hypothetical protein